VYYEGETFKGKATRVFAYYGKPEGAGPFPGIVLVHGGGGAAFRDWVKHWVDNGYAALAMDLAGNGP
ncbi:MAG: acetylxylan esterase, partial [Actinomycetes bacterium]